MTDLIHTLIERHVLDAEVIKNSISRFPSLNTFQRLYQISLNHESLEKQILAIIAERYGVLGNFEKLILLSPNPNYVLLKKFFRKHKIVLLQDEQHAQVILALESDFDAIELIEFQIATSIQCVWVTCSQLQALWKFCENWSHYSREEQQNQNLSMFETILEEAILQNCSDIHFEAGFGDEFYARFRRDGKLYDAMRFTYEESVKIISRVKILAGMDVAIKRRPQDGHYHYESTTGRLFDLRVCTIPTERGEKIAMRILDQKPVNRDLQALGFLEEDIAVFEKICHQSSGLILIVGPTGSGKTTTLYAILNLLNSREKNIMTVENPVEYHIDGINQVSIQPEQGLGFAEALKAFLRQDPDIILVGEIRDEETAQTAVRAALTGHLVLSTLHAKNAYSSIYRLRSLGIELDLLSDTLLLIVSQRLVPKRLQSHKELSNGRLPIYEMLKPTSSFQTKVRNNQLHQLNTSLDDSLIQTFENSYHKQHDLIEEVDLQSII